MPGPLLEHCRTGARDEWTGPIFINADAVIRADAPEGWKPGDPWYGDSEPELELHPRGPDMRASDVSIAEGPLHRRVKSDDRGLRFESQLSSTD